MTNHVDTATPQELADTQTTAQELADTQTTTQDAQSKDEKQNDKATKTINNEVKQPLSESASYALKIIYGCIISIAFVLTGVWAAFLYYLERAMPISPLDLVQLTTLLTFLIVGLPALRGLNKLPEETLMKFLDLDRSKPLNYPTISGFLQEQTVGGFGATIIAMLLDAYASNLETTKIIMSAIVFQLLIVYLMISYIRFIYPIGTNENGKTSKCKYVIGALISFFVMLGIQFIVFHAAGLKF
ncbi:hypothetical protein F7U66_00410 [Vibrio parahaemolyticus]|nr:hypothetical protein [Vibrio parahaemolyticus]